MKEKLLKFANKAKDAVKRINTKRNDNSERFKMTNILLTVVFFTLRFAISSPLSWYHLF